jgi:hypothetical protein
MAFDAVFQQQWSHLLLKVVFRKTAGEERSGQHPDQKKEDAHRGVLREYELPLTDCRNHFRRLHSSDGLERVPEFAQLWGKEQQKHLEFDGFRGEAGTSVAGLSGA